MWDDLILEVKLWLKALLVTWVTTSIIDSVTGMNWKSFKSFSWISLLVLWLRICPPLQETQVWSLVWEDSTCLRATKLTCPKYWNHCTLEKPLQLERKPKCSNKDPAQPKIYIIIFFNFSLFLSGGKLLYKLLVSATQQCKSDIIMHISPSSWASLPSPHPALLRPHRVPGWAPWVIEQLLTRHTW